MRCAKNKSTRKCLMEAHCTTSVASSRHLFHNLHYIPCDNNSVQHCAIMFKKHVLLPRLHSSGQYITDVLAVDSDRIVNVLLKAKNNYFNIQNIFTRKNMAHGKPKFANSCIVICACACTKFNLFRNCSCTILNNDLNVSVNVLWNS